jgi:hypothetical protein
VSFPAVKNQQSLGIYWDGTKMYLVSLINFAIEIGVLPREGFDLNIWR